MPMRNRRREATCRLAACPPCLMRIAAAISRLSVSEPDTCPDHLPFGRSCAFGLPRSGGDEGACFDRSGGADGVGSPRFGGDDASGCFTLPVRSRARYSRSRSPGFELSGGGAWRTGGVTRVPGGAGGGNGVGKERTAGGLAPCFGPPVVAPDRPDVLGVRATPRVLTQRRPLLTCQLPRVSRW